MAKERIIRGRVTGSLLGLLFGGPIGAALGFWLGHVCDKRAMRRRLGQRYALHHEAVAAAVVVLAAKLAKADSVVTRAEIETFRRVFKVPQDDVARIAQLWDRARETAIGYEPYAVQLAQMFRGCPIMLSRILEGLWAVAAADGELAAAERRMLDGVAGIFGVGRRGSPGAHAFAWSATTRAADAERVMADMLDTTFCPGPSGGLEGRVERWLDRAGARARGLPAQPWFRSTAAAISAGLAFLVAYRFAPVPELLPIAQLLLSGGVAGLCWLGAMATLPKVETLRERIARAAGAGGVDASEVAAVIEAARGRIKAVRQAAAGLDGPVGAKVGSICDIAARIVDGLLADPADVARTRPFLDHYLGSTLELVERYAALEGKAEGSARVAGIQASFEPVLDDLEKLFVKQYERNLQNEARALDLEIDVLRRMIKAEGV